MVTLLLNMLYFVLEKLLAISYLFEKAIFNLSIKVQRQTIMIFELILSVFDLFLWVSYNFIELLDPLCNYSQDRWRFYEENTVLNLLLRVFRGILINLLPNCIFCVGFNLLVVQLILVGFLFLYNSPSFLNR